ncbi:hypothetical protein D4R51_00105 [bacterium]|nr:MAG: hypothetical protein D4R51_00105 [bacterium]
MDLGNYKTGTGFKRNRRRLRFWLFAGGSFLFFAFCIGILYFILNSSWLNVKNLNAPEFPGVSRGDILNSIKTQMLESRTRAWLGPDNILFWKFGEYPDFIRNFPALKNLEIKTDLLNRSVSISAAERKLWGIVCDKTESNCYGSDENGVVFSKVPSVSGSLILKIKDPNGRVFILGQPFFSRPAWFLNFKQTIEILNRNDFLVVSTRMGDPSLREWTAKVNQGLEFYFSLNFIPENFDSILKSLGSKLDFGKTAYVDFRVPNRIYYK